MAERKHYKNALGAWSKEVEFTYPGLHLAATLAILDELRTLNEVFRCPNVQKGFRALQTLAKHNEIAFKRRVEAAARKRSARAAR
jgi:hypothetical protein